MVVRRLMYSGFHFYFLFLHYVDIGLTSPPEDEVLDYLDKIAVRDSPLQNPGWFVWERNKTHTSLESHERWKKGSSGFHPMSAKGFKRCSHGFVNFQGFLNPLRIIWPSLQSKRPQKYLLDWSLQDSYGLFFLLWVCLVFFHAQFRLKTKNMETF